MTTFKSQKSPSKSGSDEEKGSLSLIKPYFIENRYRILLGLLSLITVDGLQLVIPRIIKRVVDDLTVFQIDSLRLLMYALSMTGIAIFIAIFRYSWRRCLLGVSRRVEEGLRNHLFDHLQTLSGAYFDRVKTGDLMAHATNDIQQIRMATGMGMVALNDAIVMGLAAIGFMAYINLKLTAFVLIPMPFIVFGTRFFSKKMHRHYQSVQSVFSDLTEVVRERFTAIRVTKAHNRMHEETAKVEAVSKSYINANLQLVKVIGFFFPIMVFFSNLSLVIVLYIGGHQTILQAITPGDFVAFISYLGLLTWPMMALGWVANLIQRGRASLDRVNLILQTAPEIKNSVNAHIIKRIQGRIAFENVLFRYPMSNHKENVYVLNNINLSIQPGEVLGIVGPPGSGKSTLLNLIPRLYDVQDGRIMCDGQDLRSLDLQSLRANISWVPQEPFLFGGTIRENITFDNPLITDKQLEQAVKDAALDDTISKFPAGFDTIVGEKGIILSGGQKQRITLARYFLRNASILILDDPISQVDLITGTVIVNNLKKLSGSKTMIIVSHRLSAVSHAHRIIVMDRGHIVESGAHNELIKTNSYYGTTFRLQEFDELVKNPSPDRDWGRSDLGEGDNYLKSR